MTSSSIGQFAIGVSPIGGAPTAVSNIIPSYLYWQFSDDDALQAFVAAYNAIAQQYLNWFNATPLAVYTSPAISGPLLDWTATGIRSVPRPVIGSFMSYTVGALATFPLATMALASARTVTTGSATVTSDDVYKRVLTSIFYRGDGRQASVSWIKRRVARFLYGANGFDIAYPPVNPPSVAFGGSIPIGALATYPLATMALATSGIVSSKVMTITVPGNAIGQTFQALAVSGVLPIPARAFIIKFS